MKRSIVIFLALMGLLVLATTALAAPSPRLRAHPYAYNPGDADVTIVAAWRPHTGLPDAGPADHGLILSMSDDVAYPPGASASARIDRVDGVVLTSLGFDHKLGTLCGGGAPRWDVEMTDGSVYGIPCNEGTHAAIVGHPSWERITFSCADPSAAAPLSGPPGCAFGKTLTYAEVLVDIEGRTVLDNLDLNGCVMGKPGNC